MLYIIQNLSDKYINLLQEDPVRPHIPKEQRLGQNKDVFLLLKDDKVNAITCVSYVQNVPINENALFESADPQISIFYTIWSYSPGSGRQLLQDTVKYIIVNKPFIKRFVTLSPKTEQARQFHLKNGAIIHRENVDSVNYEYLL